MGTDGSAEHDPGEAKIKKTDRRAFMLRLSKYERGLSQRCPQDGIRMGTGGSAKHDPEELIEQL